jgi:hypothetical protein
MQDIASSKAISESMEKLQTIILGYTKLHLQSNLELRTSVFEILQQVTDELRKTFKKNDDDINSILTISFTGIFQHICTFAFIF